MKTNSGGRGEEKVITRQRREDHASSLTWGYLKVIIIMEILYNFSEDASTILVCNTPGEKFKINWFGSKVTS